MYWIVQNALDESLCINIKTQYIYFLLISDLICPNGQNAILLRERLSSRLWVSVNKNLVNNWDDKSSYDIIPKSYKSTKAALWINQGTWCLVIVTNIKNCVCV